MRLTAWWGGSLWEVLAMGQQYSPKKFLRQVGASLLRPYFAGRNMLAGADWAAFEAGDIDGVADAIEALTRPEQRKVESDFTLVTEMATEGGSVLIREEAAQRCAPWADRLDAMKNDYERAFLVLLEDPCLLGLLADYGEMDRFASARWVRRCVGANLPVARGEGAVGQFSADLRALYRQQGRGRLCHVDVHERGSPRRICYFAHPEDYPKTDLGYGDDNTFARQTRRTALETIFVYRPDDGVLEMVAPGSAAHKDALARAFCTRILGLGSVPQADARKPYNLEVLKDVSFGFDTDPRDNIERVEIRQLRIDVPGRDLPRIIVSARPAPERPQVVQELLRNAINQSRYPLDALEVTQAKLAFRFRGLNGRRPKTLVFEVTAPDRCNLKDTGHDAVAKKYLTNWGIARG